MSNIEKATEDDGITLTMKKEIQLRIDRMYVEKNHPEGRRDSVGELLKIIDDKVKQAQISQTKDIVKFMETFQCDAEIIKNEFL